MSRSMKCLQCSSTFAADAALAKKPAVCPVCGATRVVAEKIDAAPVRPALTDDDVLAFLGAPPAVKPRARS